MSKDDKFALKEEEFKAAGPNVKVEFISSNKAGLPEIYNKYLDSSDALEYDYNIFMHADV